MPLKLNSTGGGSITLDTPSTAGTYTVTVPATNQTLGLTSGTAATASGTAVDFTGIPSWVKRITVMFSDVSTNGTSNIQIQLGTGSTPTYTTSGYLGTCSTQSGTAVQMSAGFIVANSNSASDVTNGSISISLLSSSANTWSEAGMLGLSNAAIARWSAGSVPLAATLTAVRITTVNGTDTFDAGTINIMYEG